MLHKYKNLDLTLPKKLQDVLLHLENRGMTSPVLFGGAIRDSLTGYKSINDYDIRFAGLKDAKAQELLEKLLNSLPANTEAEVKTDLPSGLQKYFYDQLGIITVSASLRSDSVKLTGVFSNATKDTPYLDIGITKASLAASADSIKRQVLDQSTATLSTAASGSDGRLFGHRRFELDALNKKFRSAHLGLLSPINTRPYYERLKTEIPDLEFIETLQILAYDFLKSNHPSLFSALKRGRQKAITLLSGSTAETITQPKSPRSPATIETDHQSQETNKFTI